MEYLFHYIPKHQTKRGRMLTRHIIFQWQHIYLSFCCCFFFFKKRYSIKTIILNYLILIVVIIFLWNNSTIIISKPIEFELCYMKLTALKVDPLIYKKSNENKSWKVLRWTCNEVNILVNTYSIKNSKCKKLQDIEIKINVSTHIDKVCKK